VGWPISGHDWAVSLLSDSLASGRLAHAYLFSGRPQIGKTTLALALAQAVNCTAAEAGDGDPPCGRCPSCLKIARRRHPDVRLIEGEGAGGALKIDQVRALQQEAVLRPYEGRYRVFILRQADRATLEAADSLLKTLEEPPAHVLLILTATHAEALPPTVVSRCQRLDLRPLSAGQVAEVLEARGAPAADGQLLARLSGGRLGWAIRAWGDEALLAQRQQDLDHLVRLLTCSRVERLDFVWQALQGRRDQEARLQWARQIVELWTAWWRDLFLLGIAGPENVINIDRLEELHAWAQHSRSSQAWQALQALRETAAHLEANVNIRLALEGLLLKLPRWPQAVAP